MPDSVDIAGIASGPLAPELLLKMDACWRAANYLSGGQLYVRANPLLDAPRTIADVKPRLLGHRGTTPGFNMLCVQLNRLIKAHDLNMIYVIGPGHGGPRTVAQTYLEGFYIERHPAIERAPRLQAEVPAARGRYWAVMERHKLYVGEHGDDMPEILNWQWDR